ncbi:vanomycin resistance protein VanB [Amycolatopsis rhizosphaerae]|uniref:Vanomycin resistance protein VanB n=1 Tax=Amycolatopsis rhizosphaerae TaxID=2053003 RepID=A0A558CSF6_9PSEU|nr:VanW family protein [Amycolatopsis rhizosphaerae]TVT51612.1 vanomycin resistance protein VanB [Amycolatopsis rhizosphaerae]
MREDDNWPEGNLERVPFAECRTEEFPPVTEEALAGELLDTRTAPPAGPSKGKRYLGFALMGIGGFLVVGAILYTIDLVLSAGHVPRGVAVAGVEVGGMARADAETKLRRELGPRLAQPVPVLAGDVRAALDPVSSGLKVDWTSTLAQAGSQPLDPLDRIRSFFVRRDVGVITKTDPDELNKAVSALAADALNHPPTEGGIGFRPIAGTDGGVAPYAIEPRPGQTVTDIRGAANLVKARWLDKTGVRVPVESIPVKATSEGVHRALEEVAVPAVAKPLTVRGDGAEAVLRPDSIASALRFTAQDGGELAVTLETAKLQQILQPRLAPTERPGRDAQIVFPSGVPFVQPSEDGRRIDWPGTFGGLKAVLYQQNGRELPVRYLTSKPKLSTDDATALNVKEVVGEFTTIGLDGPAAANVQAMAAKVNGALVRPGETFSLLARIGGFGQGFVPAPVDEDGSGRTVPGGGSSQFASTLYNALYFAGLTDAGHAEHTSYIDRYPPGRDAILLRDDGSPVDLKFTDNLASGVVIQAEASGSAVTVRLWGTRQYRVVGNTGPSEEVTPPTLENQPPGCRISAGVSGFTVTDTRVLYDLATGGEVRRDTRTVRYAPRPATYC